jgi:hypothetical protein
MTLQSVHPRRRGTLVRLVAVAAAIVLGRGGIAAEPAGTGATRRLHSFAVAPAAARGAPAASTVCMRSLAARPIHAKDPHDTLAAIRGFHVTRLEWTYGDDAAFIRKVHDLGVEYGGAIAAGSYAGKAPPVEWNVVGLDSQRLVPTWMRQWQRPNPWGCGNNPEFRAGHVRAALAAVAAGADVLQRDEPEQNEIAYSWGGCLCRHCLAGFRGWLEQHGDPKVLAGLGITDLKAFDYAAHLRKQGAPSGDAFRAWKGADALRGYFRQFQTDSTVAFHQWWRAELDRQAGRPVAVSCNNGAQKWTPIQLVFDACIGELRAKDATPAHLHAVMEVARSHGRTQAVTMPLEEGGEQETPAWVRLTRRTIATMYALGGHIEMPWDTYLPTPDAQRYFGEPENYADLTAFVRGIAGHLDDHVEVHATGCGVQDARWQGPPPVAVAGTSDVFITVRTRPGDADAPLVIHLVDWREEPQPLRLTLDRAACCGDRPARVRVLTPVQPYDRAAHDRAFETRNYRPLVRERSPEAIPPEGLDLPAATPWAVVVVEPVTGGPPAETKPQ